MEKSAIGGVAFAEKGEYNFPEVINSETVWEDVVCIPVYSIVMNKVGATVFQAENGPE